ATLEVEIYRQAVSLFNLPVAAGLSLMQIGLMFVMMAVYTHLQRQTPLDLQSARYVARPPRGPRQWAVVIANMVVMLVLLFTPLLALVLRSFTGPEGLTTLYYQSLNVNTRGSVLFVPPLQAVGNS